MLQANTWIPLGQGNNHHDAATTSLISVVIFDCIIFQQLHTYKTKDTWHYHNNSSHSTCAPVTRFTLSQHVLFSILLFVPISQARTKNQLSYYYQHSCVVSLYATNKRSSQQVQQHIRKRREPRNFAFWLCLGFPNRGRSAKDRKYQDLARSFILFSLQFFLKQKPPLNVFHLLLSLPQHQVIAYHIISH